MAQQGASLQNYNNELVKCIEELRNKRDEVNRQILKDQETKASIQKELSNLTDKLGTVNESLSQHTTQQKEFESTLRETEDAYRKILESSKVLLNVLKRESTSKPGI